MLMNPFRFESTARQAPPMLPVKSKPSQTSTNSLQDILLELSLSKERQARSGCRYFSASRSFSWCHASWSASAANQSGACHWSSHSRSDFMIRPQPYRSSDERTRFCCSVLATSCQLYECRVSRMAACSIFFSDIHAVPAFFLRRASASGTVQSAAQDPKRPCAQWRKRANAIAGCTHSSSSVISGLSSFFSPLHRELMLTSRSIERR
mmetsp:Transcript_8432/g.23798  ORF Transcript_8432/g.23798 Transcript_8432/m.23798 type:complete len:208 (-) Transcript_8432:1011-1634(-)